MGRSSQRFRADERIAVGATAELWRGWDLELDRVVAIKRPHPHLVDDDETRARFLREAKNAARLTHPNVVQIFDAGVDDSGPWIAMEFAEGQTLAEHLRTTGPLDAHDAAAVGVQIAAALGHAHRIPVVHRDVKPGNVVIGASGDVRLVDFGLARLDGDGTLTAAGLVAGTPAYMAPEIIRGEPATPASDVYSLGVVLYELLSGTQPFTGDNALAVALAHDRHDPPPFPAACHVPAAMERLVAMCMAKDPARRPMAASLEVGLNELAQKHDLTRTIAPLESDETATVVVPAPGVDPLAGARRTSHRRVPLAVAAATALLIGAIGLGIATRGDIREDPGASRPTTTGQSRTAPAPSGGSTTPIAPAAQTQTATPAASAPERSPAAEQVARLIQTATSAGAISTERAARLEQRLADAERALLGGDPDAGAQSLVQMARDSTTGRLKRSSVGTDLVDAIQTLATSWGIDLAETKPGKSARGEGDGDDDD